MADLTGSIIDSHEIEHNDPASSQEETDTKAELLKCGLTPEKFSCHLKGQQCCDRIEVEVMDEDEESFACVGYQKSKLKLFLFVMKAILSVGVTLLISYWKPSIRCKMQYRRCSLAKAELVLMKLASGDCHIVTLDKFFIKPPELRSKKSQTNGVITGGKTDCVHQNGGASIAVGVEDQCSVADREVLIEVDESNEDLCLDVKMEDLLLGSVVLTFMLKNVRYVWSPQIETDLSGQIVSLCCGVTALQTFDSFLTLRDAMNTTHRVTHPSDYAAPKTAFDKRKNRELLYGTNTMDIPVKSYHRLLVEEIFNPFYCFQIVSIILWCLEVYYYYASCILVISVVSIILEVREIRNQAITLKQMSTMAGAVNLVLPEDSNRPSEAPAQNSVHKSSDSKGIDEHDKDLSRQFYLHQVAFEDLVPGDVIEISTETSKKIPVDCLLVAGTVIVNESSLTGESVPVNKTALRVSAHNYERIDFSAQSKHLLFAGTELVRVNQPGGEVVMAYVLRTGFLTVRGQMIRSMLHPKPIDSQFYSDAFRFVGVMSVFAIMGTVFTIYDLLDAGDTLFDAVTTGLDIITILVPPALPSALSIGIHYAIARLKKRGIFCISPQRVNLSGQVDTFCFDKTGTLTEEGLDIYGFLPVQKNEDEAIQEVTFAELSDHPGRTFQVEDTVSVAMATCHSLVVVDDEVCGDPIEVKMFDSIGWTIVQSDTPTASNGLLCVRAPSARSSESFNQELNQYLKYEVAILHELPFSSHIQRMSVVVKRVGCPCPLQHNMELYCKGAPEVVASLCKPESIPSEFNEKLRFYTNQGFRVLALATRDLGERVKYHKVLKMERSGLEQQMSFIGLLVLQNKLKPETTAAIETLSRNEIKSVMITGDNLETAASVAQECKIVLPEETLLFVRCTPQSHPSAPPLTAPSPKRSLKTTPASIQCVSPSSSSTSLAFKLSLHHSNTNQPLTPEEFWDFLTHRRVTFAIAGKDYANLRSNFDPETVADFAKMCSVYSRMKPDQKTQVVKSLQDLGHVVGMCGDGSNDCSALKAAHVGVALSQADASVASPFTSKVENISCVQNVIQEGRCALVTSFSLFKFMMLYSMVQYGSVQLLYVIQSNLGDTQQMYEDMVLITILALLMGRTGPAKHLVPKRPQNRLLSFSVVFSVFACAAVQMSAQLAAFFYVRTVPWYVKWENDDGKTVTIEGYENTAVFLISNFQYVYSALVFSKGYPYRKAFFTNRLFTLSIASLILLNLVLLLYPPQFLLDFFQMLQVDNHHQFLLVLAEFSLINLALLFLLENIIIAHGFVEKLTKRLFCMDGNGSFCCRRNKQSVSNIDNHFIKTVSAVYC